MRTSVSAPWPACLARSRQLSPGGSIDRSRARWVGRSVVRRRTIGVRAFLCLLWQGGIDSGSLKNLLLRAESREDMIRWVQCLRTEVLGATLPHLRRDWAHRCRICAGTGL